MCSHVLLCWVIAEQPHLSLKTAGLHTCQMCSILPHIFLYHNIHANENRKSPKKLYRSLQLSSSPLTVGRQKLSMASKLLAQSALKVNRQLSLDEVTVLEAHIYSYCFQGELYS